MSDCTRKSERARGGSRLRWGLAACLFIAGLASARATETENLNIRILPPPGKVAINGKADDWDLSGGVFVCGDAENQRDKMSVWIHAMYDAENLYVLARGLDETPMSNPGSIAGDHGWNGDCLQLRIIADPEKSNELGAVKYQLQRSFLARTSWGVR